jgi:hypothetical protein
LKKSGPQTQDRSVEETSRFRFFPVLIAMLVYWGVAPLLKNFVGIRMVSDVFFSAALISAVYAVAQVRLQWIVATILAVPMIVSVWLLHFWAQPVLELVGSIFEVFFFAYTAATILSAVLRASDVSREVIAAAVVVYMFLGMFWAGLYSTLELLFPGSFTVPAGSTGPVSQPFVYFSFTTLTTLGYGDITPVSGAARAFATLEALLGQIYLAVLIARLVGIHASRPSR